MENNKINGRLNQMVGLYGEYYLSMLFLRKDIECFKPIKDANNCDMIIRNNEDHIRLQIKTTTTLYDNKYFQVRFKEVDYEFDFDYGVFICYDDKKQFHFYIVPRNELGKSTIVLPLYNSGYFSRFKDNWEPLTNNKKDLF